MEQAIGTAGTAKETKESPIENAMTRLKKAISSVKDTMVKFEPLLSTVLTNPEKPTGGESKNQPGQTSLESRLNEMTVEIEDIGIYLREIQSRIQL